MSAHTPGPWTVTPRENRRGQKLQPSITAPRNGYRGFPVCVLSAIGAGEDEANARLIAAAPRLLAANAQAAAALDRLQELLGKTSVAVEHPEAWAAACEAFDELQGAAAEAEVRR
jgi:hypothetical protein